MKSKSSRQLYRRMRRNKLGNEDGRRCTGMSVSPGTGTGAANAAAQVNAELRTLFKEPDWQTKLWLWWDKMWFEQ